MGTTAQKLSYLNETKTKLKDKINLMGANITDDTFRSYPDKIKDGLLDIMNNGYEKVWNNWDKVTGSGTEITLNNTEEAPMKLELKGNTSQDTTTGKNKLGVPSSFTVSSNYLAFQDYIDIPAGTYILSVDKITTSGSYSSLISFRDENGQVYADNLSSTNKSKTITLPSAVTKVWIYSQDTYAHSTGISTTFDGLMLRPSSVSDATYEPYTGGKASPNPDYPQEVKVVKGDNKIKITGKNLIDIQKIVKGRLDNGVLGYASETTNLTLSDDSFSFTTSAYWRGVTTDYIEVEENTDYIFNSSLELNPSTNGLIIASYDKDKNFISNISQVLVDTNIRRIPTPSNCKYIRINVQIRDAGTLNISNPQLEKGTSATDYEPYKGTDYPLNLGVENLFNKNAITDNKWLTISGGEETSNNYCISDYIEIQQGKSYYLPKLGTKRLKYFNSSKQALTNDWDITNGDYNQILTIPTNAKYVRFSILKTSVDINTFQFEEGTIAHSYSEYGVEPLELCKITPYQDKIIETNGKNIFNVFSNIFLGSASAKTPTISSDGKITSEANYATARGKGMFVELESNTTYTLSFNIDSIYASAGTARVFIEGKIYNGTSPTSDLFTGTSYDTTGLKSITFTTPTIPENQKCGIIFNGGWYTGANVSSTFSNAMIEKGSTATEYQPYGSGEYYKKEMAKKLDLSTIPYWSRQANGKFYLLDFANTYGYKNDTALSNLFTYSSTTWVDNCFGITSAGVLWIATTDTSITGYDAFITWLGNKNAYMIGILSSPNYKKITNNTLIKQLDAIKKSKNSQTNISQENDGLPFELDVSALMEF